MIDILHRHTEAILYHSETAQTIAGAVEEALAKGADLEGADLEGAKNYINSHDFFAESVRRQPIDRFVAAEWAAIGQIVIHRPCWDVIHESYADVAPQVLDVLAEAGFAEWREHWGTLGREETVNA